MNPPEPRSVALYARVSGDEQAEAGTIGAQVDFFRRWCDLHGHACAGEFLDDGVTGTVALARRPAGAQLLAAVKAGAVKDIVCYRTDRIGRDTRVVLEAVSVLETAGAVVRSMTEPFDTSTPAGRLILSMLAGYAGYDRESILERMAGGMRRKATAGLWIGGGNRAAYGYKVMRVGHDCHIEIDDSAVPEFGDGATRVDLVKWLFEQAAAGQRLSDLANQLNALGVPSYLKGKWLSSRLAAMVHNSVYKGVHVYGDGKGAKMVRLEAAVPAIVSPDLWERAQEAVETNRRMAGGRNRNYLLRGLIWCGDCGAAYTGLTMSRYANDDPFGVVYRCNRSASRADSYTDGYEGSCKGGQGIKGAPVEDAVWKQCAWWLLNPDAVRHALEVSAPTVEGELAKNAPEIARIEAALRQKEAERDRAGSAFIRGLLPAASIEKTIADIAADIRVLESEAKRLKLTAKAAIDHDQARRNAAEGIRKLAARIGDPDKLDQAQRREVIEQVVERITVTTIQKRTRGPKGFQRVAPLTDIKVKFRFVLPKGEERIGGDGEGFSSTDVYHEGQINLLQMVSVSDEIRLPWYGVVSRPVEREIVI